LQLGIDDATAADGPLSLLIADIDHFKKFNDTFGHQVGDKVLRTVGRSLKDGVKGRDTAARYGGEEFAVILPQTPMSGALAVAEQIRGGLAGRKLVDKRSGDDYGRVTLSIGAAEYRSGESAADLIGRADAALYRAKENGRNRVEPEEPAEPPLRVAN
jgi:diguanylate cyclase